MIDSYSTLKKFINADRNSLRPGKRYIYILVDPIWRFQVILRFYEYVINRRTNAFIRTFVKLIFNYSSRNNGFSIPPNVFGPGLSIAHYGTIAVNGNAKIGANCRIHVDVCIGASGRDSLAPKIGDDCYIGPGVKIFGNVTIESGVAIGANSVVNKSILEKNITVAGNPSRVICNSRGSEGLIKKGYNSNVDV
ncbi:serine O-acetyltransferase [Vibrio furnissii]|uniref:serine O-acetyltransferase n=1 Tax=Vibrio furnissii TaxID=29494 RepID=UPI001EECC042|nr:serine acetyltransferase [Vibrio furnissii]